MNLTHKILLLDADASNALKDAETLVLRQKQETDTHFAQLKEEQEQSFENQKREEAAALTKKLKTDHQQAIAELENRMKVFNKKMTVDKLVEQLLSVARDRVCR